MAIHSDRVEVVTVGDLLSQDLRIPPYQRPYRWGPGTAQQLLDDIKVAFDRAADACVLGAVILHDNEGRLDVVDGQQRLLTLLLIQFLLMDGNAWFELAADSPVGRVRGALSRRIGTWSHSEREQVHNYVRDSCQLVKVVTDDIDEAFRVFDSQNFRGKPLKPHDLLKAHHLRHMRGESEVMTTAVVEAWESAGDEALDYLFSTFLFRIARWSRDQSALPGFIVHDIGMFKGIDGEHDHAPAARYHLAAQSALPLLNDWIARTGAQEDRNTIPRDASRARFQLDAPIQAGRPFFEMVAFMLDELEALRKEAFLPEWEKFSSFALNKLTHKPGASRYRYVSELYLAALLYYTNKFGDRELEAARRGLFIWAYALRVELERVQLRSIDGRARGGRNEGSAFGVLREAVSASAVHQVKAEAEPRGEDHERELAELLRNLGAS